MNGVIDAGAVSNTILSRLIEQNIIDPLEVRIIWKSEAIPESPFIARGNLNKRIIRSFTEAMVNIHIKDPDAFNVFDSSIEQFLPVEKSLYNPIRNIINILGNDFIDKNSL